MGARTYKGFVEWIGIFEGEESINTYATSSPTAKDLLNNLWDTIDDDGNVKSIEIRIKRVETD